MTHGRPRSGLSFAFQMTDIEIDIDGVNLGIRFRERADNTHMILAGYLRDWADEGAELLRLNVPKRTGRGLGAVDSTGVSHTVTGALESMAGIRRSGGEHMVWPDVGTGTFVGGLPIRAKPGNLLAFDVDGRTVFTREVKGQPPQRFSLKTAEELDKTRVVPDLVKIASDIGNL